MHQQLAFTAGLLRAKIANVTDISQTDRQDGRHVRILAALMPAYLKDICDAAVKGRIEERDALDLFERLLKAITARKARKVLEDLKINPGQMFAAMEVDSSLERLRAFIDLRLPGLSPELKNSANTENHVI